MGKLVLNSGVLPRHRNDDVGVVATTNASRIRLTLSNSSAEAGTYHSFIRKISSVESLHKRLVSARHYAVAGSILLAPSFS
jgi:hypothetical protein